jgi:hypothetical protein
MSDAPVTPRWRILLTPRWLSWHLFAVVAVAGMIWLGDWQFRRAVAGNTLSWAYTFEWPIFAIFGVVFWVKTIRDELHPAPNRGSQATDIALPGRSDAAGTGQPESGQTASGQTMSGQPGEAGHGDGSEPAEADQELAEYNAYLSRLSSEVKGHGRWHGLR